MAAAHDRDRQAADTTGYLDQLAQRLAEQCQLPLALARRRVAAFAITPRDVVAERNGRGAPRGVRLGARRRGYDV
jgi:hypothetical protein